MVVLDDGRRRRLEASRCRMDNGGQWAKCKDERDDEWKEGGGGLRERRRVPEMATREIHG